MGAADDGWLSFIRRLRVGLRPREATGRLPRGGVRLDVVSLLQKDNDRPNVLIRTYVWSPMRLLSDQTSLIASHRQDNVVSQVVFPPWEAKSLYRQAGGRAQVSKTS